MLRATRHLECTAIRLDCPTRRSVSPARLRRLGALRGRARMPLPEPIANPAASVSPFLLLPPRPLPAFAADLRCRLSHVPAGIERASLARMIIAAEGEIALRRAHHERR